MTGTLFGVGVGPGDPELLTLRAVRILGQCRVVAYPQADDKPSTARAIAGGHINPNTTELPYRLAMTPDGQDAQKAYDALAARLVLPLQQGQDVAILCEGDPLFYGSFAEVMHRLAGRFPVSVVPGVSAAHAAAAALPLTLVQRNECWTVLPAPLPTSTLEAMLGATNAAAILKLGRHYPRVRALLDRMGLTPHAYYCERVGQAGERLTSLSDYTSDTAPYFSLILVRKPSA